MNDQHEAIAQLELALAQGTLERDQLKKDLEEAKATCGVVVNAFKGLQMLNDGQIELEVFDSVMKASGKALMKSSEWLNGYVGKATKDLIAATKERDQLRQELLTRQPHRKRMYYWEDVGGKGWDVIVQAPTEAAARELAAKELQGKVMPDEAIAIATALGEKPTGVFFYDAALWIFTETDPMLSRVSQEELDGLRKIKAAWDAGLQNGVRL